MQRLIQAPPVGVRGIQGDFIVQAKGKATLTYGEGKGADFPVFGGSIGPDVVDIRTVLAKTGMFTYDPGFLSTASCQSAITYICLLYTSDAADE